MLDGVVAEGELPGNRTRGYNVSNSRSKQDNHGKGADELDAEATHRLALPICSPARRR
jgi:hypothetical protein